MKDYVHISVILDCSGSMDSIKVPTITNFNKFLRDQKEFPGKATFTFAQFSGRVPKINVNLTVSVPGYCGGQGQGGYLPPKLNWISDVLPYRLVCHGVDIKDVSELNNYNFDPCGGTPLIDSIVKCINETGNFLRDLKEDERPEKVIFVIITDGEENGSVEYSRSQLNEKIKHQEELYNWQFIFLGANQDAIHEATSLGMKGSQSMTYGTSANAINETYSVMSRKLASFRAAAYNTEEDKLIATASLAFTDDERKGALDTEG